MNKIEEKRKLLERYHKQIQTVHGFNMYGVISSKALNNAISKYGKDVKEESVLALYDNTISQNGKQGFLFTDTKVCYLEVFDKPKEIRYADIMVVMIGNENAKKDSDKTLEIVLKSGQIIVWKSIYFNKTPLCEFFTELIKLEKNEVPKAKTTKSEQPKLKAPKGETPKVEAPKEEFPKDTQNVDIILKKFKDVYDTYRKDYAIYLSSRMIPEKKLENALITYAKTLNKKDVICLIDVSASSNGKEGYIFTKNEMYWCLDGKSSSSVYENFSRTEYVKADSGDDRYGLLKLHLKDGRIVLFHSFRISKMPMQILLNSIINKTDIDLNMIKELAAPKVKEGKNTTNQGGATVVNNSSTNKEEKNKKKISSAIYSVRNSEKYKNVVSKRANISKISKVGGHISERFNTVDKLYAEVKFSGSKGHGYAAERANHIDDVYKLKRPQIVGDDFSKNGADRLVDNMKIQTKYCKTPNDSINACFDKDGFRYMDSHTGKPMIIEVPKEQYVEAVRLYEEKIREGKIPGVSDPAEAKNLVKKGSCTYKQAVNIAKAGTVDSLIYDSKYGAVYATQAMGISLAISFALSVWNGEEYETALKNATKTGLKVFGRTFVITVASSQLARTGLNAAIKPGAEAIVDAIGPKASKALVNAFNHGTGTMAKNVVTSRAVKLVQGTIITTGITILVISTKDIVDMFRGRISQKQLFKNVVKTTTTTTAATIGGIAGKCVGTYASVAIFGPVCGALVKPVMGFAGSMAGAMVASAIVGKATDVIMDQFIEDDAKAMERIIENRLKTLADDYCICHEEMNWIVECISCGIDEDMIKDIYASKNRSAFVDDCIVVPCIEAVVADRPKIQIPETEDYFNSVVNVLEEIEDEINEEENEHDNFTIISSEETWNFIDKYAGQKAYYTYVCEDVFSMKNGIDFDSNIEEIMEKLPVGFMEDVNLEQDIIYDLGKKYNNKDVTVLKYAKTCYTYVLDYFSINFYFDSNGKIILIGYLSLDYK